MDGATMTIQIKPSLCSTCKWDILDKPIMDDTGKFLLPACKAYPEGIPEEILTNKVDHHKPYKGDNGIQYEPRCKSE